MPPVHDGVDFKISSLTWSLAWRFGRAGGFGEAVAAPISYAVRQCGFERRIARGQGFELGHFAAQSADFLMQGLGVGAQKPGLFKNQREEFLARRWARSLAWKCGGVWGARRDRGWILSARRGVMLLSPHGIGAGLRFGQPRSDGVLAL